MGRPNVGKSTLFNRLTRSQDALVADYPGLTRDRQYGTAKVGGWPCIVVDTGGLSGEPESLDAAMAGQTLAAVEEADLVVFIVDGRDGLVPTDSEIADRLRRGGKRVLLCVNKSDGLGEDRAALEFHELGFENPVSTAASHNRGVRSLMDAAADLLGIPEDEQDSVFAMFARLDHSIEGAGLGLALRRTRPMPSGPGGYAGGLAGIWAPELTRESVWQALNAYRTYGTSLHRIYVEFTIDGQPMGSELDVDGAATIQAYAITKRDGVTVELLRDNAVIATRHGDAVAQHRITHRQRFEGRRRQIGKGNPTI